MSGRRSLADLVLAVHMANRNITERAADDEALRGMGTTVCVVGMVDEDGEHVAVLNVGDSRVYLFAAGELHRLTEDHSLVETLVREGRITPEEAEVHPQRNVLTRALGVEALVVVDAWLLAPCQGDRLLLCSDGLFNELGEDRIAEVLAEGDEPEVAARRLAAEADAAGGRDNITTVVVDVVDAVDPAEPLDGRFRRIATPTVDLDDAFHDPANDTATVPLVPISAAPPSGCHHDDDDDDDDVDDDHGDDAHGGDAQAVDADAAVRCRRGRPRRARGSARRAGGRSRAAARPRRPTTTVSMALTRRTTRSSDGDDEPRRRGGVAHPGVRARRAAHRRGGVRHRVVHRRPGLVRRSRGRGRWPSTRASPTGSCGSTPRWS